jgi:two-component system sensor kinase FixL
MSWITVVWSISSAVCLTIAGIYLLVWWRRHEVWMYLLFAAAAFAAAVIGGFELASMRAATAQDYGILLRWAQLPVWMLVVSLVWFVRLYFRAGRIWLAWTICGLRTLVLALNFLLTPNLNYLSITTLRHISWWGGETVAVPVGVTNPWTMLSELSFLLLLIFLVDVTITAWRRGERQPAVVVGGSTIFFVTVTLGQSAMVIWGVLRSPFFVSFPFLGVIMVMAYELSYEVLRSVRLASDLEASWSELHESEQRLDLAASGGGLGLWTWNVARNQIWINDQGKSLFGFQPSERIDIEQFRSRVHPDDRESLRVAIEKALSTGTEYEIEYRVTLPDGQIRWLSARGRVEFTADGKPEWIRGVSIDITERKRAEEKFRVAVEASPIGIVLVNHKGRIVLINTQTERLFGYRREEIVDQPMEMLVPERFRAAHPGYRATFLAAPEARAMGAGRELFARRKDGTEFPVEIGLSPMTTAEGTLVLGAIMDITARKQAELEAQRHRAEITHLSRVALMGEMSASFAHELNQPLAAIVSNAAAGQRFIDSGHAVLSELRELLADIAADGRRASDVVQGIRSMVKKGEKVMQRINLNDIVMNVAHIAQPDALLRSCQVKISLEPNLPAIEGDPVQLRQVVLNLMINAFDAMQDTPAHHRIVEVTTVRNDNGSIRVSVRDHGAGVGEEARKHLFDPFFTTKQHGLGMGLAIVRSIVESHGGTIGAENLESGGACFHFTVSV